MKKNPIFESDILREEKMASNLQKRILSKYFDKTRSTATAHRASCEGTYLLIAKGNNK